MKKIILGVGKFLTKFAVTYVEAFDFGLRKSVGVFLEIRKILYKAFPSIIALSVVFSFIQIIYLKNERQIDVQLGVLFTEHFFLPIYFY